MANTPGLTEIATTTLRNRGPKQPKPGNSMRRNNATISKLTPKIGAKPLGKRK